MVNHLNNGKSNHSFEKVSSRRYLIVCRVGDNSIHGEWIEKNETRNFDLFLDYFGDQPNRYRDECDYYIQSKGLKWPGLYSIIENFNELIFSYDAVWLPDDDISVDTQTINEMFDLFTAYDLLMAQPALTKDSYFTHGITIVNPEFILRFTDFVEIMVPLFSKKALSKLWSIFNESQSGWGLDNVWIGHLDPPEQRVAIIDKTPVKHTRPVGGGELYQKLNISPHQELTAMIRSYNAFLRKFAVLGGLLRNSGNSSKLIQGEQLVIHLVSGAPVELLSVHKFMIEYLYPNVTRIIRNSIDSENELTNIIFEVNKHNLRNLRAILRFHDDTILNAIEKFATNVLYVLVTVARALLEEGQYERSLLYLNTALRLQDRDPEALYYTALIMHLHGQNARALKLLELIGSKTPKVQELILRISAAATQEST